MAAKGSDKNCCCCGCSTLLDIQGGLGQGGFYCCTCVPRQICATLRIDGEYVEYITTMTLNTQAAPDALYIYHGAVNTGDSTIDLAFYFLVDPYSGNCRFCFDSQALGVSGACIAVDEYFRSSFCATARTCQPVAEIPFTSEYYSGAVAVSGAPTTSLIPMPLAYGCPDPCDGIYVPGYPPPPCGICQGCDCLCSVASIIVVTDSATTQREARLCNSAYVTADGFVVGVSADYYGFCQLELVAFGDTSPDVKPPAVSIGHVTLGSNPCPNPTAVWTYRDLNNPYATSPVQVFFNCVDCAGVAMVSGSGCCYGMPMPVVVHAEFTMTPNCYTCGLLPVDVLIDVVWNPNDGFWEGSWSYPADPGCPYEILYWVKLRMGCLQSGETGMQLDCSFANIGLTGSGTCSPGDYTFTGMSNLAMGDCGVNTNPNPFTFTVRVMW